MGYIVRLEVGEKNGLGSGRVVVVVEGESGKEYVREAIEPPEREGEEGRRELPETMKQGSFPEDVDVLREDDGLEVRVVERWLGG